ncbi:hypothetical protein [Pseudomonas sp.]|jgi:hypothetical protein|uniref:hypothetical protein n=1 Tax=Pseudomonas sp. TaxID=306 RepID=UPI002ED8AFF7
MIPVILNDAVTDQWMEKTITQASTAELIKTLNIVVRSGWNTFADRVKGELAQREEQRREAVRRTWQGAHTWYVAELARQRSEDAAAA